MKKIITLLCVSFFALVSCSKDDSSESKVPSATATQAVLDGATVKVTWPAVVGSGITYNIYRNDDPVKINAVPLTEATYTDVLKAVGSYTYTITVNLADKESEKGLASEKVVFVLPKAPIAQAVLNGATVAVTWPEVAGTGVTYNVYKNDNPVKINAVPLTEAKFNDILMSTGSCIYTITVNLAGLESEKGTASEKVVLALPKTSVSERKDDRNSYKYESIYTYDASNIAKLVSVTTKTTSTKVSDQSVTVTNSTTKYTYTGDLITKSTYYNANNVVTDSNEYLYNAKNQLTSNIYIKADGSINYTVNYAYNDNGTVTETATREYWGTYVYSYLSGNQIKEVATNDFDPSSISVSTTSLVYDTKYHATYNILGYLKLYISGFNNEVSSSTTVTSGTKTSSFSSRIEYTYDANDYVLSRTVFNTSSSTAKQTGKTVYTYN
jgi:hypothetical protein